MHRNANSLIKFFLVALVGGSAIAYATFRANDFMKGPQLAIHSPASAVLATNFVEVSGSSKNISHLTLNGRKIFTDKTGAWKEKMLLFPGMNVIQAYANDRFGRETIETVEVFVDTKDGMTSDEASGAPGILTAE